MMLWNKDEAIWVLLQEGDPDLQHNVFANVIYPSVYDDNEYVLTQEYMILFNMKWNDMLFNVLLGCPEFA